MKERGDASESHGVGLIRKFFGPRRRSWSLRGTLRLRRCACPEFTLTLTLSPLCAMFASLPLEFSFRMPAILL